MKRFLVLLLTLSLAFSFASCGSDTDNGADNSGNTAVEDNNATDNTADNQDNNQGEAEKDNNGKIEKSIDAVADYLNLKKGDETLYNMIGAKAGREYNNGEIELYEFDKDSAEYKDIIEGKGSVEAAAYNDGIIMVVTKKQDNDLIRKFENIKFK